MKSRLQNLLATVTLSLCASGILAAQEEATDTSADASNKKSFMSQFKDPDDGMFDASQWLLENAVGFMPIPIIITEPAVDNGLGVAGIFFHSPNDDQMKPDADGNVILPNISVLAAAYTGNDSWMVGAGHARNRSKDHYRYSAFGGYADITLDWYGNGNFPIPENGIRFNTKGAMLIQEFLVRMGENKWFLGANWRYMDTSVAFGTNLPISLPIVENSVSGLGIVGLYENLDSRLSPRKGFKMELIATVNSDVIGSDFDYEEFSWKIRQYFEIGEKYTLSWRVDGATTSGDVPFYLEPFVDIEGIPAMRYQGATAVTAEVRGGYDVRPRWTLLGFLGGGRAADSISSLSSASTHTAYGVGFRYLMAKRLGLRAGIDIAHGPEGTYVYLVTGSAW